VSAASISNKTVNKGYRKRRFEPLAYCKPVGAIADIMIPALRGPNAFGRKQAQWRRCVLTPVTTAFVPPP
jgi:hypothetical protein